MIIRLAGGLGNQIFQLGACLLIAEKLQIKNIIIDDYSLSSYDVSRKNELNHFFITSQYTFKKMLLTRLRLPIKFSFHVRSWPLVSDNNFQNVLDKPNKSFMLLDGYFQECLTQNNFNKEIQLLQNILIPSVVERQDGCVIHIRGGDFVKLGWDSITPKEYYVKAIEIMKDEYQQNKFYIVTDDREYSKTILNELDIEYQFIGHSMYEDFRLIGSFKYRVLSSSTFALWASALGDNENSIVIAPKYWTPNHQRNIILPNEVRIEF